MTHEQAERLLLDLAYGELGPEAVGDVERHAASCAACSAELARIARVRSAAARLGDGPPPPDRRDDLVEAARRAVATRRERRWFTRPAAYSLGAAAAVVAIVLGVTLQLTGPGRGTGGDAARVATRPPPAAAGPTSGAVREGRAAAPAAAPVVPAPSTAGHEARRLVPDLVEERRQLRCGGALIERVALVTRGGRVVKLTERRGDAVAEAWYDDGGESDARRGAAARETGAAAGLRLPPRAPTLEAVSTRCEW